MLPKSYLIAKWTVYALATLALAAVQHLVLGQISVLGVTPFLYPMLPALVASYEGLQRGSRFSLVMGFDREVREEEVTVMLDGIPARFVSPTDVGRRYAESAVRFDGNARVSGLYLFSLPEGCTEGNPVLSLKAEDDTLSLSYVEILIGTLPADDHDKGVRK